MRKVKNVKKAKKVRGLKNAAQVIGEQVDRIVRGEGADQGEIVIDFGSEAPSEGEILDRLAELLRQKFAGTGLTVKRGRADG